MDRKLASIQRITSLTPIPGADLIEKATILGWELVVAKKDKLKVNDLIVYCEVDSILPDKPEFEFLRDRKFRIKTIKLRSQISQGICFPLSILPKDKSHYSEGQDVTEILEIRKHDPQAEYERKETDRLASISKNRMDKFLKRYKWYRQFVFKPTKIPFPTFIRKTDEDRIQLFPNFYERWDSNLFEVTEKIDGQSATYFCIHNPKTGLFQKKWLFGVCSRNFQLLVSDNSSYWTIAKRLSLKNKMIKYCELNDCNLIIQGEIIGPKIQGNKYNVNELQFFVFNLFTKGRTYEKQGNNHDLQWFCSDMGLEKVPFLEYMYLPATMQELVEYSKGNSKLNPVLREGVVVRSYSEKISFKIINPEFLLKYDNA